MANLFDLKAGIHSNKLLTDWPHYEDSYSRQSDVGTKSSPQAHRPAMEDNVRTWNRKGSGILGKGRAEEEMSMEVEFKDNSPNLVAKLMGLDALPLHQSGSAAPKVHVRDYSPSKAEDFPMIRREIEREDGFSKKKSPIHHRPVEKECKDMHENWQRIPENSYNGTVDGEQMSLVRRKFMEAKRLAADEKLRQSKEFQDVLEVLSSNRDLCVRFLQEPNSMFSKNLYEFPPIPQSPGTNRITVLRPSHIENLTGSGRRIEKTIKKPIHVEQSYFPSTRNQRDDEFTVQPTRIVVLKPSHAKIHAMKKVVSPPCSSHGNVNGAKEPENGEVEESRRLAKEITHKMRANLTGNQVNMKFINPVFSNDGSGNDSSFNKSETEYAVENSSDSEFMSPSSRHSWDYMKKSGHPFSPSSFNRASPESSVSKEAKKRLSQRWAVMASCSNAQEQRGVRRNSNTLGEMLALSETRKSVRSEDEDRMPKCDTKQEFMDNSPKNLPRLKSIPESSSMFNGIIKFEEGSDAEISKTKNRKSSIKGKVSSFFFSRDKKISKDEIHGSSVHHPEGISSDLTKMRHPRGIISHEKESVRSRSLMPANVTLSQDQPSPFLVLEPPLGKNSSIAPDFLGYVKPDFQQSVKSIIDKSPPIESIVRTLQCDSSCSCTSTPSVSRKEEERNFLLYVQALLKMASLESNSFTLQCYSLENPFDPSLRYKYANLDSKEPVLEAKKRELRSSRALVFDSVVSALSEITDSRRDWNGKTVSYYGLRNILMEGVLTKMKEWFDRETSFESGGLVLERVVREKVVGREWGEDLEMEVENLGREIEMELLEELVEDAVSDFEIINV